MSTSILLLGLRGRVLRPSLSLPRLSSTYLLNVACPKGVAAKLSTSVSVTKHTHVIPCGYSKCGTPSLLHPQSVAWCVLRFKKGGKDKGGKDKKNKGGGVTLSADQLDGLFNVDKYNFEMDRVMDGLKDKFINTVTVRTKQGVFDNLEVKTDDGNFPLIQLGQIIQKNPQMVTINLAMSSQYIPNVKDALMNSGLNINPQQDGTSIFVQIPMVTKEHRQQLSKNAKVLYESSKKDLRNIYSKYSKKIRSVKEGKSADEVRAAEGMAKDIMDKTVTKMEEIVAAKQKELLGEK